MCRSRLVVLAGLRAAVPRPVVHCHPAPKPRGGRHREGHHRADRLLDLRVRHPDIAAGPRTDPTVAEPAELTDSGLESAARCGGLPWRRQTTRMRVCSSSSRGASLWLTALTTAPRRLVRTGSGRRQSWSTGDGGEGRRAAAHPVRLYVTVAMIPRSQDVAVDDQFNLTAFRMTLDRAHTRRAVPKAPDVRDWGRPGRNLDACRKVLQIKDIGSPNLLLNEIGSTTPRAR